MVGLDALAKELESGMLRNVYLVYGDDSHSKREAVRLVREKALAPGFEMLNEVTYDAPSANDIIAAAETLPVMLGKRVVTVRDYYGLKGAEKSEGSADETQPAGERENDTAAPDDFGSDDISEPDNPEMLEKWLDDPARDTVLIFYESGAYNSTCRLFKKLNDLGGVELKKGSDTDRLIDNILLDSGKTIDAQARDYLVKNSRAVYEDLGRVISYIGERDRITAKDVRECVSSVPDIKIFELFNAFIEGRNADGFEMLNTLVHEGLAYEAVLPMWLTSLRTYLQVRMLKDTAGDDKTIAKILNFGNAYRATAILKCVGRVPTDELKKLYIEIGDLLLCQRQGLMSAEDTVVSAVGRIDRTLSKKIRAAGGTGRRV